ncbi:hypothetical protein TVAG_257150 [Trichomonas vaginalis G3]|uniref:HECT domain-containing protein n=1 Tax=Trichomonas vaginalis (strain ATCC PRA-98 / G3) TaxID=412133 RepID=A2G0P7_TRIV3|nr:hypothetical protein TVAGG3_0879650 [Trichomonas vaginalis G3]EAX89272.1 hypothetical protein TVAG_257150 [Trichomonas vaginalis G3]KAI5501954.1 hypothetical protein TVAGG3_0879650 [Trichomonas vaginalis G3]|eukprot:XP_001302202.1 hypothetical protein [Trichomonas vaginalis G3]
MDDNNGIGVGSFPCYLKNSQKQLILYSHAPRGYIYSRVDQKRNYSLNEMSTTIDCISLNQKDSDSDFNSEELENEENEQSSIRKDGDSDSVLMEKVIFPVIRDQMATEKSDAFKQIQELPILKSNSSENPNIDVNLIIMKQIVSRSFQSANSSTVIPNFFKQLLFSEDQTHILMFIIEYITRNSQIPISVNDEFSDKNEGLKFVRQPYYSFAPPLKISKSSCFAVANLYIYMSSEFGLQKISTINPGHIVCINKDFTDIDTLCAITCGLVVSRRSTTNFILISYDNLQPLTEINQSISGKIYGYMNKLFVVGDEDDETEILTFQENNKYTSTKSPTSTVMHLIKPPSSESIITSYAFLDLDPKKIHLDDISDFITLCDPFTMQLSIITKSYIYLPLPDLNLNKFNPEFHESPNETDFIHKVLHFFVSELLSSPGNKPANFYQLLIELLSKIYNIQKYEKCVVYIAALLSSIPSNHAKLLSQIDAASFKKIEEISPFSAAIIASKSQELLLSVANKNTFIKAVSLAEDLWTKNKLDLIQQIIEKKFDIMLEASKFRNDDDTILMIVFMKMCNTDGFKFDPILPLLKTEPTIPYNYIEFVSATVGNFINSDFDPRVFDLILTNLKYTEVFESSLFTYVNKTMKDYFNPSFKDVGIIDQTNYLSYCNGTFKLDNSDEFYCDTQIKNYYRVHNHQRKYFGQLLRIFQDNSDGSEPLTVSQNITIDTLGDYACFHMLKDIIFDKLFYKAIKKESEDIFKYLLQNNYYNQYFFDFLAQLYPQMEIPKEIHIKQENFSSYESSLYSFDLINFVLPKLTIDDQQAFLNTIIHADYSTHTILQFQSFLSHFRSKIGKFNYSDQFANDLINEYLNLQFQPSNQIGSLAQLILATLTRFHWNLPNKDELISNITMKTLDFDIPPLIISLRTIIEDTNAKWALGGKIQQAIQTLCIAYNAETHQQQNKSVFDWSHRYAHQIARILYLLTYQNFDEVLDNKSINTFSKLLVLSTVSMPAIVGDKFEINGKEVKLIAISPTFLSFDYKGAVFSIPSMNFMTGESLLPKKKEIPKIPKKFSQHFQKFQIEPEICINLYFDLLNAVDFQIPELQEKLENYIKEGRMPSIYEPPLDPYILITEELDNYIDITHQISNEEGLKYKMISCPLNNLATKGEVDVGIYYRSNLIFIEYIKQETRFLVTRHEIVATNAKGEILNYYPFENPDGKVYFVLAGAKSDYIHHIFLRVDTFAETLQPPDDYEYNTNTDIKVEKYFRPFISYQGIKFLPYIDLTHEKCQITVTYPLNQEQELKDEEMENSIEIGLAPNFSFDVTILKEKVKKSDTNNKIILRFYKRTNDTLLIITSPHEQTTKYQIPKIQEVVLGLFDHSLETKLEFDLKYEYFDEKEDVENEIGNECKVTFSESFYEFDLDASYMSDRFVYRQKCDFKYGYEYPCFVNPVDTPTALQFTSGTATGQTVTITNTDSMTVSTFDARLNSIHSYLDDKYFFGLFNDTFLNSMYKELAFCRPEYHRVYFDSTKSESMSRAIMEISMNHYNSLLNKSILQRKKYDRELPDFTSPTYFVQQMIEIICINVRNDMFISKTDYSFSEHLTKSFMSKDICKSIIDFSVHTLRVNVAEELSKCNSIVLPNIYEDITREIDGLFILPSDVVSKATISDYTTELHFLQPNFLFTNRSSFYINRKRKVFGFGKLLPFSFSSDDRDGFGKKLRASICFINHLCEVQPEMTIREVIVPILELYERIPFSSNLVHWILRTFERVTPDILLVYEPFTSNIDRYNSEIKTCLYIILLRLGCYDARFSTFSEQILKSNRDTALTVLCNCLLNPFIYFKYGITKLPDKFILEMSGFVRAVQNNKPPDESGEEEEDIEVEIEGENYFCFDDFTENEGKLYIHDPRNNFYYKGDNDPAKLSEAKQIVLDHFNCVKFDEKVATAAYHFVFLYCNFIPFFELSWFISPRLYIFNRLLYFEYNPRVCSPCLELSYINFYNSTQGTFNINEVTELGRYVQDNEFKDPEIKGEITDLAKDSFIAYGFYRYSSLKDYISSDNFHSIGGDQVIDNFVDIGINMTIPDKLRETVSHIFISNCIFSIPDKEGKVTDLMLIARKFKTKKPNFIYDNIESDSIFDQKIHQNDDSDSFEEEDYEEDEEDDDEEDEDDGNQDPEDEDNHDSHSEEEDTSDEEENWE